MMDEINILEKIQSECRGRNVCKGCAYYDMIDGCLLQTTPECWKLNSLGRKTPVEDLTIKKVITSDPATIVFWNDGTKTVVKCQDPDTYSPKLGVLYALARKFYSNTDYSEFLDKLEELNADEPLMVEIDLYSVIKQKYIERDILDKIRAEFEEHAKINQNLNPDRARALCWCLDVIDKYTTESKENGE